MPLPRLPHRLATLLLSTVLALGAATALARNAPAKKTPARTARTVAPAVVDGPAYASRDEAMRFADELAQTHALDREWVRQAIGEARLVPTIQRLMQPQPRGTAKNWGLYRSRLVDPKRIQAGAQFWQTHRASLERAQARYGVPAEIIVGILGVETLYGQRMGRYRVIDALATLAFDFPAEHPRAAQRQAFFRDELTQFLLLTRQAGVDPLTPLGSYAGAMGMPQFMPSSWRKYAVDFDGNGRIDLFHSPEDAIGSVANYFKSFNWRPGQPTHYPVRLDMARLDRPALLAPDILPTFSVEQFTGKGAMLEGDALLHPGPLALIELQNGDLEPTFVAGTENFYAITRYNWSSYYAMAVIDLGREVAAALAPVTATEATTQARR